MKLRNKKTGGLANMANVVVITDAGHAYYKSLAELNEEWEDTKKPLIKDEKIRKAVSAWAEANSYKYAKVGFDMVSEPNNGQIQMHFEGTDIVDESEFGIHSIDELCGEEEE